MPVSVTLTDAGIDVSISGMDVLWSLRGAISIPWPEVVGARVVDAKTAKRRLNWRVGGTSWPGRVVAGHFTVRNEPGVREWWVTYRDPEFLEIETTREDRSASCSRCRTAPRWPRRSPRASRLPRSAGLRRGRRVRADLLRREAGEPEELHPHRVGRSPRRHGSR